MGSDVIYNDKFENGDVEISLKDFTTGSIIRIGELYNVKKAVNHQSALTEFYGAVDLTATDDRTWGDKVEMKNSVALKVAIQKIMKNHGDELFQEFKKALDNIDYYYVTNEE